MIALFFLSAGRLLSDSTTVVSLEGSKVLRCSLLIQTEGMPPAKRKWHSGFLYPKLVPFRPGIVFTLSPVGEGSVRIIELEGTPYVLCLQPSQNTLQELCYSNLHPRKQLRAGLERRKVRYPFVIRNYGSTPKDEC